MLYRFVNDNLLLNLTLKQPDARTPDEFYLAIRTKALQALDAWRVCWSTAHASAVEKTRWHTYGFFRHGDKYEAVTRILFTLELYSMLPTLLPLRSDRLESLRRLNKWSK